MSDLWRNDSISNRARGLGAEIIVVISVAFLPPFVTSLIMLFGNAQDYFSAHMLSFGMGQGILHHLFAILLGVYVIWQRGESVREFGIAFKLRVIPISLGLFVGGYILSVLGYYAATGFAGGDIPAVTDSGTMRAFGNSPVALSAAYIVTGALFEELLVRAYLITRLRQLGWNTPAAVLLSTLVQAAYHVHQGPGLCSTIPLFLLFSVFFARYRNALAIVLAHVYINALMLASA